MSAFHRSPSPRLSWLTLYGEPIVLMLAVVTVALAVSVNLRPPETNGADFYTFWDSARWYLEGVDPYLGHPVRLGHGTNLNVPAAIPLFVPFTWLPLRAAFLLWTASSVLVFAFVGRRIARVTGTSPILVVAAILASQATFSALQLGQVTAILMALFTLAWIADREDRPRTAGLLLGLTIGLKPFLAPFAVYAAWRRSRPLLVWLFAGIAAVFLVGLIALGPAGYRGWLEAVRSISWTSHVTNGSILGQCLRLLTYQPEMHVTPLALADAWVRPLWFAASGLLALAAARAIIREPSRDRAWLLIALLALLISPLGWTYYVPIVAGPLIAFARSAGRAAHVAVAIGYVYLSVPYTVMNLDFGRLGTVGVASAGTWGILVLFAAAVWAGRPSPGRHDSQAGAVR